MTNDLIGEPARSRDRRAGSTGRGVTRLAVAACLAATATFALPPVAAQAKPKPTHAQAQKKLDQLNELMDKKVEQYNQNNEKLKIAKKKLAAAKKAAAQEQASFDKQRSAIAQMAADAYKNGDSTDVTGFVGSGDPQAVLDQAAVFTQLSEQRSTQLTQFLATAQRLRREQAQAQSAYNDVKTKHDEIAKAKRDLDKQVRQQKKLVQQTGGGSSSGGSGGGIGGTYNGPASGSAKKALDFAYAQLGKPYSYGATGPGSFDCSGLTMRAWEAAGVNITRTTNSQWAAVKHVSQSDLQPGDLVFFSGLSHVGMYVGGGKFIHAPHTGDVVKISPLSGYYTSNFYGAGRP
ncbi:C40 family peptidase [Actinomadura verrucosospora]|uniref:NLP/P60 protein n=1 Tax=Actinomadura verrucosospora TaxID=46165 RepID=A0A7D3W052_ACTVE|nr:C40 family peptidase [Actinomadura verrucosospora]QKG26459.1 NLP/P60 protein [Actinomadura verrucosospora]